MRGSVKSLRFAYPAGADLAIGSRKKFTDANKLPKRLDLSGDWSKTIESTLK